MLYGKHLPPHTTYGSFVYMLMNIQFSSIEHIDKLSICFVFETFLSSQHMENLSICCMEITFSSIQQMEKLSVCCMEENFMYMQYIQPFHMFFGRLHYHFPFFSID